MQNEETPAQIISWTNADESWSVSFEALTRNLERIRQFLAPDDALDFCRTAICLHETQASCVGRGLSVNQNRIFMLATGMRDEGVELSSWIALSTYRLARFISASDPELILSPTGMDEILSRSIAREGWRAPEEAEGYLIGQRMSYGKRKPATVLSALRKMRTIWQHYYASELPGIAAARLLTAPVMAPVIGAQIFFFGSAVKPEQQQLLMWASQESEECWLSVVVPIMAKASKIMLWFLRDISTTRQRWSENLGKKQSIKEMAALRLQQEKSFQKTSKFDLPENEAGRPSRTFSAEDTPAYLKAIFVSPLITSPEMIRVYKSITSREIDARAAQRYLKKLEAADIVKYHAGNSRLWTAANDTLLGFMQPGALTS